MGGFGSPYLLNFKCIKRRLRQLHFCLELMISSLEQNEPTVKKELVQLVPNNLPLLSFLDFSNFPNRLKCVTFDDTTCPLPILLHDVINDVIIRIFRKRAGNRKATSFISFIFVLCRKLGCCLY